MNSEIEEIHVSWAQKDEMREIDSSGQSARKISARWHPKVQAINELPWRITEGQGLSNYRSFQKKGQRIHHLRPLLGGSQKEIKRAANQPRRTKSRHNTLETRIFLSEHEWESEQRKCPKYTSSRKIIMTPWQASKFHNVRGRVVARRRTSTLATISYHLVIYLQAFVYTSV